MSEDVRRVTVNFSDSAYQTLHGLADRKGKTMSEILRDSIALEKWLADLHRDGGRLIVERPDGTRGEVIPR